MIAMREALLPALALVVLFGCALATPDGAKAQTSGRSPTPAGQKLIPASVKAAPDLRCTLRPKGDQTNGIPVFTDNDGYARFHAVKVSSGSPRQLQTLTCTDEGGRASAYDVDLASDETFVNRPLDLANEPGVDRPALTGDPNS